MKNRIHFIFSNTILLEKFIRELVYPAILGSLLYELVNLRCNWQYYLLLATAFFYSTDYFYMNSALTKKKEFELKNILMDGAVALLFAYIIASIYKSWYIPVLMSTSVICILAYYYLNDNDKFEKYLFGGFILSSIVAILLQLLFTCYYNCHSENAFHWIYLSMVILYILVVSIDYWHTENIK